jgi:hypothetical protein
MTIESKLKELQIKKEEQWERCKIWLDYPKSNKQDCTLIFNEICPCRCDYYLKRTDIKKWGEK